jgi:hypothetical protein
MGSSSSKRAKFCRKEVRSEGRTEVRPGSIGEAVKPPAGVEPGAGYAVSSRKDVGIRCVVGEIMGHKKYTTRCDAARWRWVQRKNN